MFKLSIITINLNNEEGLKTTINSVINQTFRNFEYIIIDGNSQDNSLNIIEEYSKKINYYVCEKDNGIYNAMNKGIRQANGEYCLFLNSGDYLYDDNVLSNLFKNDFSESIILCESIPYSKFNRKKKSFPSITSSKITFNDLFNKALNHQSTLIRTELFNKYGFYDERYKIIADRIFFIKTLGLNNESFKFLGVILSVYDIDGISSDVESYYYKELKPAFRELLPKRILVDYENGYINIIEKLKKYFISWFCLRVLVKFINIYEKYLS